MDRRKQDGLFSHIASYKSDLLVLDVDSDDYPVPAEDFIDANVTEFRTLQVEANVHPVLVRWSARLAEAVRARAAEEPDLSPAAIARWTFQELFYVGMVAGVDDSLAMSVAAFLSTSSTKQALRLARIVGLGSERALEREVTRQLSFVAVGPQLVLEAPRRGDHAQVASSVGTVGSGGPRYNVDKIPLEVTVPLGWSHGSTPLGSDELLVFLFRNPIAGFAVESAMDRRFGCTETSASATIRWEHLQMGEGDTVDAYASRVRMEAQLFARVTGTALTPSLIVTLRSSTISDRASRFLSGGDPLVLEVWCRHDRVQRRHRSGQTGVFADGDLASCGVLAEERVRWILVAYTIFAAAGRTAVLGSFKKATKPRFLR
ncbi:hypothetical protein FOZ60_008279 [Perkinsus olseni]|uniref:Uncharacterized protein n=1 Tax=Perkinsus olseni TaxID=32597 RepID=A0A7J6PE68_PEROL|nr:hypothetical protein FOZ60_008279 [Perkinsus olseni]